MAIKRHVIQSAALAAFAALAISFPVAAQSAAPVQAASGGSAGSSAGIGGGSSAGNGVSTGGGSSASNGVSIGTGRSAGSGIGVSDGISAGVGVSAGDGISMSDGIAIGLAVSNAESAMQFAQDSVAQANQSLSGLGANLSSAGDTLANISINIDGLQACRVLKDSGLGGLSGLQGLEGLSGLQGIEGLSGLQGLQGLEGLSALQGLSGLSGIGAPQMTITGDNTAVVKSESDDEDADADSQDDKQDEKAEKADKVRERADREEELYNDGMDEVDDAKWDKALDKFDQVIEMHGKHADGAMYWKAYSENKQGHHSEPLTLIASLEKQFSSKWVKEGKAMEMEIHQSGGNPAMPEGQSDCELKLLAVNGLQQADPEKAIPILQKMLRGGDCPKIASQALFVLAQSGSPEATKVIGEIAMGQSNPELQHKAIQDLGLFSGSRGRDTLLQIYTSSSDVTIKKQVLNAFMLSGARSQLLSAAKSERILTCARKPSSKWA